VTRRLLAVLCCPIALGTAAAQHWEFERVDWAGWGQGVQIRRHPDGRLCLCYESSNTGQVRLAWEEDTWRHEDVPQPAPAGDAEPRFAFAPDGTIGVTYGGPPQTWLSRRIDTTWVHTPLPESGYLLRGAVPVTFDSAGQPVLATNLAAFAPCVALALLRLHDTAWLFTDTIVYGPWGPIYYVSGFGNQEATGLWGVFKTRVQGTGYWYEDVCWFRWQGRWETGIWFGGYSAGVGGHAGAVDRYGTVHASYSGADTSGRHGFFYDYSVVDSGAERSALAIDTLDRPLIAFTVGSALKFCYRDVRGWHFFDVGVNGVTSLDLLPGPDGQPLIAYATNDGVFLARGVDVTSVEEGTECQVASTKTGPTIVRGVLWLPRDMTDFRPGKSGRVPRPVLLDAAGRAVTLLRPGPNDISRLPLGVYFARSEPSAVGRRPTAVTRVVVAR